MIGEQRIGVARSLVPIARSRKIRSFRRHAAAQRIRFNMAMTGDHVSIAVEHRMTAKGLDASDKVLAQAIALRAVRTLQARAKRRLGVNGSMRRRMAES